MRSALALRLLRADVRGLDPASVCASASIGTPGAPLWLGGAQPSSILATYQSEWLSCLKHPCCSGKEGVGFVLPFQAALILATGPPGQPGKMMKYSPIPCLLLKQQHFTTTQKNKNSKKQI